jgi:hypothetical protein
MDVSRYRMWTHSIEINIVNDTSGDNVHGSMDHAQMTEN